MYDLLIKNGIVVDGTGAPPEPADILVGNGVIERVTPRITESAKTVVNAEGQYVAPGFIDIHRHSDAFVFRPGYGEVQVRQGVTTTVNGNCGLSVAPCPARFRKDILQYLKPVVGTLPEDAEFETFGQYLDLVSRRRLPINFGMHVGNGTLRMAAKGFAGGELSREELAKVHRYLEDALDAGAFGVSIGLIYSPENAYDFKGLVEALSPLRGRGIPIVSHIRGEGTLLLESVREVVALAKAVEAPLHISHYKCVGAKNWGHLLREATDAIEREQAAGMSITVDVYPWLAGSSLLAQVLPPEFGEGGLSRAAERLRDPEERARCRRILSEPQSGFENQALLLGWENIMVGSVKTEANRDCEGKRVTEIAAMRGTEPDEAALTLLAEEDCEVSMINFIACDEDVDTVLRLPYSFVVSDSIYPDGGKPHPRQYGTFPKLLAEYVRERKVLDLATAVKKCTSAPAERFGIAGKGCLRPGYDADMVIFDLDRVANHADYLEPRRLATGFSHVFVNGVRANENDSFVDAGSGRVIRRKR